MFAKLLQEQSKVLQIPRWNLQRTKRYADPQSGYAGRRLQQAVETWDGVLKRFEAFGVLQSFELPDGVMDISVQAFLGSRVRLHTNRCSRDVLSMKEAPRQPSRNPSPHSRTQAVWAQTFLYAYVYKCYIYIYAQVYVYIKRMYDYLYTYSRLQLYS